MFRTIRSLLAGLTIIISFISCEKEYSLENGSLGAGGGSTGGTAVFTAQGAPGACLAPFTSGSYVAGTAMTAANTVIITVDVTTAGTYTISSGSANGVTFSGAGTFTDTGLQFIELTAAGTPAAVGTFNYTPGTNGCSFSITFTASGGSSGTAVYTFQGAPGSCTTPGINGTYTAGTPLNAGNTVVLKVDVTTAGSYSITTGTANAISFSGSGTLAAGSGQTITLTGSGTPGAAGNANFSAGAGSCTFSINTNPPQAAVFTLNGAPGNCEALGVNGSYVAGTPLGSGNTVVLTADVTTAGSYSITTATVNGISFTSSGTLAVGPSQTITLTGSGTPTAAGTNNYTPGVNGCAFPITVTPGSPAGSDFLKCTIAGVATEFNTNLAGAMSTSGDNIFGVNGEISSAAGTASFDIELVSPTPITTGTYKNITVTNTTNGILAVYVDNSDQQWVSSLLTANTFTVNITSISATGAAGTFSGTLYKDGAGPESKAIANGSFNITF